MSDQSMIDELSRNDGEEADHVKHVNRCGVRFRFLAGLMAKHDSRLARIEKLIGGGLFLVLLSVLFGKEKGAEIALKILAILG